MKLIYNGVDLVPLATHFRVLQQATVREPADAPQRERVTVRVRFDFFEQTYADNASLMEQVRAALKTQQAVMLWQDDSGANYLERTVTAGDDESGEEAAARGGTYWQSLTFSFWYYNHDLVTNCLNASVKQGDDSLDLGAVEKWEERLNVQRFDEMRDVRRMVDGGVSASGRWQGDTTQSIAQRRQSLLAQKDAMLLALTKGASVQLSFGSFVQTVRVVDFKVDVNQPNNFIAWSLNVRFTRYPDESNYALCEFRLVTRENKSEGIPYLNFSGRIQAPTESAAREKLALLNGALVPEDYILLHEETDVRSAESASGNSGDGSTFLELSFTFEYRDASTVTTTFQRQGANTPTFDLGTVDKFADRYSTTLFDDLRPHRKRTAGMVTVSGKWYVAESLSPPQKQAALIARKQQLDAQLTTGISGRLVYGTVFNQIVRILDFNADLNRLKNCVEWSLSAGFTRFPNESDYALCEFQLTTRENKLEGAVILALSGRIGAPSPETAREKLARLRGQLIPSGYAQISDNTDDHRIDCEQNRSSPAQDQGDGPSYIQLTFNEEWQKAAGDILSWTLRITDDDDVKSGFIRTTYAGAVQARAGSIADAFTTAKAKAEELGDNKYPFQIRSSVTENERLFQTSGGVVFVTVEFSYEYQRKGERTYTEVTSELSVDTFGLTTETVSGTIAAPTLAQAQAAYTTNIRNIPAYKDALILNERTPTLAQQRLADGTTELARLDERFSFSFQVLRAKSATSMAYSIEPHSDLQTLEKKTVVRGTVRAASKDVANAFLDQFLSGLGDLGKKVESDRPAEYQRGPAVNGTGNPEVFVALHFTETFIALLTGTTGILECEVTEQIQYSGDRIVEKPIPDGVSIMQKVGIVPGRRVVNARAVATTETAALTWVKKMRMQLLTGAGANSEKYEAPPQVSTTFRFLPQTDGTPRGAGANVRLYECQGTFSETLPDYGFS
jgi:hypothetical protein